MDRVTNGFVQLNIPHVNVGNGPDVAEVSIPAQIVALLLTQFGDSGPSSTPEVVTL